MLLFLIIIKNIFKTTMLVMGKYENINTNRMILKSKENIIL